MTFLRSILDTKIKNNVRGNGGVEEFREEWKLDQPESRVWKVLEDVLVLGRQLHARPPFLRPVRLQPLPRNDFGETRLPRGRQ